MVLWRTHIFCLYKNKIKCVSLTSGGLSVLVTTRSLNTLPALEVTFTAVILLGAPPDVAWGFWREPKRWKTDGFWGQNCANLNLELPVDLGGGLSLFLRGFTVDLVIRIDFQLDSAAVTNSKGTRSRLGKALTRAQELSKIFNCASISYFQVVTD